MASAVVSPPLRGPKRAINRRKSIDAAEASSAFLALTGKLIAEERFLACETALTDQALSGRLQAVFNRRLRNTQRAQFQAQTAAINVVTDLTTDFKKRRLLQAL